MTRDPAQQADLEFAIIGTGFAGLGMAIKLQEAGMTDFLLFERATTVGGTWRDNNYPGAACDVPSHLYSFSFAQNPDWSRKYPTQAELYAYLQQIARDYDLHARIRFEHRVEDSVFDPATQLWTIHTNQGAVRARYLISANGVLAEPATPNIPGIDKFQGKIFHSAQWDHDFDLRGKKVACIGTGASAIQFVPEIAPQVENLDVYQRTPPWIIPRADRRITRLEKWLLRRVKPLQWLYRWSIYWHHEARVMGFVIHPWLMKIFQFGALRHMKRQVADPELQAKLTPDYMIGCKRILISNDWYPALCRDNVNLVTSGIQEIREHSIIDSAGIERPADALVLGTGFVVTDNPIAQHIKIKDGPTLAQTWADGEQAYLGTMVAGFPNLFLMTGPNTLLGHTSVVFMIETQVGYIMRALKQMRARGAERLEVRPEVQTRYNDKLQARLRASTWSTGCKSWYQNKDGKITTLWPGFTFSFWLAVQRFRAADYLMQKNAAANPAPVHQAV